jgi:hypothetical protein
MSDPTNSSDPRLEDQDGAVRDVDDPQAQQDTVSGGAPDEPDTSDDSTSDDTDTSEESGA